MKRYRKPSFKNHLVRKQKVERQEQSKERVILVTVKKGSGWINDPERAAYNHLYNKTTQSVHDHSSFDGGSDFISNCFSFIGVLLMVFAGLLQFALTLFMIAVNIGAFVVIIKIFLFFISAF